MKGNYSAGLMSWQPPSASQRHVRTCPPLSLPMLTMKFTGYRGFIKQCNLKSTSNNFAQCYSGNFNKSEVSTGSLRTFKALINRSFENKVKINLCVKFDNLLGVNQICS